MKIQQKNNKHPEIHRRTHRLIDTLEPWSGSANYLFFTECESPLTGSPKLHCSAEFPLRIKNQQICVIPLCACKEK
mgnify:CR=1 FL=1